MAPNTPLPSMIITTWSEIPAEILMIMFSFLCFRDRLFCRLVCRSWAAAERLLPPPRHLPWLMFSRRPDASFQRFFSPSGSTMIEVGFPDESRQDICCGSFDGWLVFNDKANSTCLLNPVSKSRKPLPQGLCYPFVFNHIEENEKTTRYLRKVVFSSPPDTPTSDDFHLAAIYDQGILLHGWEVNYLMPPFVVEDILFDQKVLWAITIDESVFAIQLRKTSAFTYKINRFKKIRIENRVAQECDSAYKKHVYLVQFEGSQKLVMILRYYVGESSDESTITFRVHELVMNPNPPDMLDRHGVDAYWAEKDNLDGHVIFLSSNCSRAILASEYEGSEEDKIYFADEIRYASDLSRDSYECGDIGVFSLKDESITKLIEQLTRLTRLLPGFSIRMNGRFYYG